MLKKKTGYPRRGHGGPAHPERLPREAEEGLPAPLSAAHSSPGDNRGGGRKTIAPALGERQADVVIFVTMVVLMARTEKHAGQDSRDCYLAVFRAPAAEPGVLVRELVGSYLRRLFSVCLHEEGCAFSGAVFSFSCSPFFAVSSNDGDGVGGWVFEHG